jgi:hypothetical protein
VDRLDPVGVSPDEVARQVVGESKNPSMPQYFELSLAATLFRTLHGCSVRFASQWRLVEDPFLARDLTSRTRSSSTSVTIRPAMTSDMSLVRIDLYQLLLTFTAFDDKCYVIGHDDRPSESKKMRRTRHISVIGRTGPSQKCTDSTTLLKGHRR